MNVELMNLSDQVAGILKKSDHTVAVSESSSGGLISAHLLAIPGASKYFIGSVVLYTRTASEAFINVTDQDLFGIRSATEEYALLNARKVKSLLGTTWGIAETGASGPKGNSYGDPPGHSCIAISGPVEKTITISTNNSDREMNMIDFAKKGLEEFISVIS